MITGNEPINPTYFDERNQPNFKIDNDGITLRQYYAGLAMQGLMVQCIPDRTNGDTDKYNDWRAEHAVHMADAMVKALNKV